MGAEFDIIADEPSDDCFYLSPLWWIWKISLPSNPPSSSKWYRKAIWRIYSLKFLNYGQVFSRNYCSFSNFIIHSFLPTTQPLTTSKHIAAIYNSVVLHAMARAARRTPMHPSKPRARSMKFTAKPLLIPPLNKRSPHRLSVASAPNTTKAPPRTHWSEGRGTCVYSVNASRTV